MIDIIIQYKVLFALFVILGVLLTLIFQDFFKNLYKKFISTTTVIRKYWSFVFVFCLAVFLSYIFVLEYSSDINSLNINLNILGQVAPLIFAIFVGYFAFLQVVESRIGKLKEEGLNFFKSKEYPRAIKAYEAAHDIDIRNFYILSELLELYIIQKDFTKFSNKISLLRENSLSERENLIILYLETSCELIKQHVADAKDKIKLLIDFQKSNKDLTINWDFLDIQKSPAYLALDGELKKYFNNLCLYLSKTMTEEQKNNFENGNYLLNT